MCGIVGLGFSDKILIKKMMNCVVHRGSDQQGLYVDDKVSLGHQRLSIIDLSVKGKQPMSDMKDQCIIVFNGEIYNHAEIRRKLEEKKYRFDSKSDTEVIINAYLEYGTQCVEHLNGDFAFCIYDKRNSTLFLARDRLGIKPLFYYFDGNDFMFASEYKAFLQHDFDRELNRLGLSRYVSLRYNYGRQTLLENVFRILPGEMIVYDLKKKLIAHARYWEVKFSPDKISKESEAALIRKTRDLLQDSVTKRLMSDVPLGVYLSGGIDSGSIVGLMSKSGAQNIKTFSVGFGEQDSDETKYSRLVSEKFSTEHREFTVRSDVAKDLAKIVWHCDEPLADPALLPVYFLSEKTKPHATVVLTGDGGDEVFAGYEQNKFLKMGQMPKIIRRAGVHAVNIMPSKALGKIFKYAPKLGAEGKNRAT